MPAVPDVCCTYEQHMEPMPGSVDTACLLPNVIDDACMLTYTTSTRLPGCAIAYASLQALAQVGARLALQACDG